MNSIDLETRIRTAPPVGANPPQATPKSAPTGPSFDQVLSERLAGGAEPLAVTAARANGRWATSAATT